MSTPDFFPAANRFPPSLPARQEVLPAGSGLPMQGYPSPPSRPSAPLRIPLPTQPRTYPMFWRTPFWSVWRPIVAFVVMVLLALILLSVFPLVAIIIDLASGRVTQDDILGMATGRIKVTPMFFLFNNIGIASCIPLSFLISRWFFKQKAGWIASITGRFRWKWMFLVMVCLAPLWLLSTGFELWSGLRSGELTLAVNNDTWFLIAAIVLTTPLQCAGEEYGDRGILNRAVASLWDHPIGGPIVGAVISSLIFVAAHSSSDILLNVFYFTFGMIACWMTWRTGGLEAAIAMHVVNNLLAMVTFPFTDISGIFDRQAGAVNVTSAIHSIGVPLLGMGIVELLYRWKKPENISAPGLAVLPKPVAWPSR